MEGGRYSLGDMRFGVCVCVTSECLCVFVCVSAYESVCVRACMDVCVRVCASDPECLCVS